MADFYYPENDLDNNDKLLGLLGGFWYGIYQGKPLLKDIVEAKAVTAQQTYFEFLGLIQSISRYNVPVFSRKNWHMLAVLESEFLESRKEAYEYTTAVSSNQGTAVLSTQEEKESTLSYDGSRFYGDKQISKLYRVVTPLEIQSLPQLQNQIIAPTKVLAEGIDYIHTNNSLFFKENIFEDPAWPKRDIIDTTGEITDRECTIWAYNGTWDLDEVYAQFGYALGLKLKSSKGYKDFINAIFDCFVYGSNVKAQLQSIASAFGLPMTKSKVEIVEKLLTKDGRTSVVTDKHVYHLPPKSSSVVAVGESLPEGTLLADSLQVYELNRGFSSQDIQAITVDKGLLSFGFFKGITFENAEKDLVVTEDVDGYTKVSWDLGGFEFDVEAFWDLVHANGVAEGETLAHLLDLRDNPTTEPTALNLPVTINPLQFLIDNFLRNNAYIVKLKIGDCVNRLKFFPVSQFKKAQPPHTVMILLLELNYADSPLALEGQGTSTSPGYEENATGFPCMVAEEPSTLSSVISENVKCKLIGGRCI